LPKIYNGKIQNQSKIDTRKNPDLQDSPPAAGRFATDFIPAAAHLDVYSVSLLLMDILILFPCIFRFIFISPHLLAFKAFAIFIL
jgi:hypothetical protein